MEKAKYFISNGLTKEALELIEDSVFGSDNSTHEDEFVLIKGKFERIESQHRRGIIDNEKYQLYISQLNNSILGFLNHLNIENKYKSKNSVIGFNVVDVTFLNENDVIDIKIRNISKEIVYIKKVIITIKNIYTITPLAGGVYESFIPPSENYDIKIPFKVTPYSIEKNISQAIKTSDVDRFTFSLLPIEIPFGYHFAKFDLTFEFNENDSIKFEYDLLFQLKETDFRNQTFVFADSKFLSGERSHLSTIDLMLIEENFSEDTFKELYQKNVNEISDIERFNGIMSPLVKEVIQQFRKRYT